MSPRSATIISMKAIKFDLEIFSLRQLVIVICRKVIGISADVAAGYFAHHLWIAIFF